ncbi:MAG: 16S rRNA (cytosine(1402)-N(4))-methyltransferase RsmH [candidate division Zixibacteria bacterium]|nr:16S rRNA (cytosine(1402)-N(4))-methyltransferase RsmH [candidate division Zixibacteria bacterium]MDH3935946.1 16S rRNA (cytosine(1402)-N(4))-methyltransferase RsmH [candidate division Zixibacteria bacterium]MDH4033787.1 16S rRNA (cytosine(1402)-N(4))-methyltransferase RsmH [candidate division Zixibacteria bacterium]
MLVAEVVELLIGDPEGAYIDLTAGGGGHMKALAKGLGRVARLYGLDKDPEAVKRARQHLADCGQVKQVVHAAYGDLKTVAGRIGETSYDGILIDLGLSSDQLADAKRGFSFSIDGPLDMRFDPGSGRPTAAELINSLSKNELTAILRDFGEVKQAARLAGAIVRERQKRMLTTTRDLAAVVKDHSPPPHRIKLSARVFQSLRIAVNAELAELTQVLPDTLSCLKPGGRLAVISYHSLEDRMVKRFFQEAATGCICPPKLPVCACDKKPQVDIITRRSVTPSENEKAANPRSRSARLRVAQRLAS